MIARANNDLLSRTAALRDIEKFIKRAELPKHALDTDVNLT